MLDWFETYRATIDLYGIEKRNIINTNEAGFHNGCPNGQNVLVPTDVREVSIVVCCTSMYKWLMTFKILLFHQTGKQAKSHHI